MNRAVAVASVAETEVVAKAKRRGFTAEYKQRILNEVDQARASGRSGEVGAILRREGLYSSHLVTWRRLREAGELSALAPRKRGPRAKAPDERDREIAKLRKEKAIAEARLKRAEALLGLQKKVSEILGIELPPPPSDEEPS
jgi:transposase-like protein